MVVAARAEEAVEPAAMDEDERVSDEAVVYLVEVFEVLAECELEAAVEDAVCEDGVAVVAEEDLDGDSVTGVVLDFVREPVE